MMHISLFVFSSRAAESFLCCTCSVDHFGLYMFFFGKDARENFRCFVAQNILDVRSCVLFSLKLSHWGLV